MNTYYQDVSNERRQKISEISSIHVLQSLAKIISEYDYFITGTGHLLNNNINISSMKILANQYIVCETFDYELIIFDPRTKNSEKNLKSHRWMRDDITVTQKGKILSGSDDGRNLRIWDPMTDERKIIPLNGVCFENIFSSIETQNERIWCSCSEGFEIIDPDPGTTDCILYNDKECYQFVSLSSEMIINIGLDVLQIWNTSSKKCIFNLDIDVHCIKVTEDKRIICGLANGEIWILRPEKETIYIHDITLNHNHGSKYPLTTLLILSTNQLVSAGGDTIKIWDIENGTNILTLYGHTNKINCLAELPDGRLISGSDDHTMKIWNLNNPLEARCQMTLQDSGKISTIQISANGQIISGSYGNTRTERGTLKIWD